METTLSIDVAAEVAAHDHVADLQSLSSTLGFHSTSYDQMDVTLDPSQQAAWIRFNSVDSPSFTPALLNDLLRFEGALAKYMRAGDPHEPPVKFLVFASRMPGTYNLGGDLGLFADCIRRQDRAALSDYARMCCEMVYHGYMGFRRSAVVIGLVQGDALGGGFECALSCGVIVAERKARFGMPEILFNMFPGMGAYSLLSRRIGQIKAEQMILSGKIYTAEELFEMGLVDVLAEDGEGEKAVQDYISRNMKRHGTILALHDVRRRVGGLEFQELIDVTERWVDEAMKMDEGSLRRMERLRLAQARRSLGAPARAA
jgi:DSF synthase